MRQKKDENLYLVGNPSVGKKFFRGYSLLLQIITKQSQFAALVGKHTR